MKDIDTILLIKKIVTDNLGPHARAILITALMIDDAYDAEKTFTVINDVLPANQFKRLAEKLEV